MEEKQGIWVKLMTYATMLQFKVCHNSCILTESAPGLFSEYGAMSVDVFYVCTLSVNCYWRGMETKKLTLKFPE